MSDRAEDALGDAGLRRVGREPGGQEVDAALLEDGHRLHELVDDEDHEGREGEEERQDEEDLEDDSAPIP